MRGARPSKGVLRSVSRTTPRPAATSGPLGTIGARYQLINELGRGGTAAVYRVVDRLTGRVVTLKRLRLGDRLDADSIDRRAALAEEFRLLASLRHPHIISVLDYGFDDDREPYFTMDLQENARTIIEAGAEQPLAVQVDLLVQTLRALVYLHRCGIIHRDLKPENILVVHGQVKVLDFGLSFSRADGGDVGWAGTPAYMAPEVLQGARPDECADLYAVGMIGYELFAGRYPFPEDEYLSLRLMNSPLPLATDTLDARLRPVLERLLAKAPAARYASAADAISALGVALDQSLQIETVATREGILQTAPLVGRDDELQVLLDALHEAMGGHGRTWIVSGESGVGKSRLLDEVRTRALIEAALVVRGQAVSQGGGPYHVWRDVLSNLVLRIELGEAEASALKAIVPDIGALLGREVEDPPSVDSQTAQSRLLLAVEQVFRAQPGPVLVILEDLHWVGSESLALLAWLTQPLATLPILLLCSLRDDEAPELPPTITDAQFLALRRLQIPDVAALGESIIGPAARRTDVLELLVRESEGIPFFIVEVVRSLAESAGRLEQIADAALPTRVMSGGMQRVIRRRLGRVPPEALRALKIAAIIGREIDTDLLKAAQPQLAVDEWAALCARSAVLVLRDQRWHFAHDKLREQLLEDLAPQASRALHHGVAEAIERVYPDRPEYVTALAHHWRQAGEPEREARSSYQAGILALRAGACQEAVAHLERTLDLLRVATPDAARPSPLHDVAFPSVAAAAAPRPTRGSWLDLNARVDPDSRAFHLGLVESALSEATYRLGDLATCGRHSVRALKHFGQYVPRGKGAWVGAVLRQLALRCALTLWKPAPTDDPRRRRVVSEIGRVQLRLTDTFFYALRVPPILWSSLRTVNQCEPGGPSPELAEGYVILALIAGIVPLRRVADRWARRALATAERAGTERDVAWILSRIGVLQLASCRWSDADAGLGRATEIAERVGDLRLREESQAQIGALTAFSGQFPRALDSFHAAYRCAHRSGNRQVECWSLLGEADVLVRLGREAEALPLYATALGQVDENAMKTEAIWVFGMLALARLRSGDPQGAYEMADRALWHVISTQPVAYWTQPGTAATAEVLTILVEQGWHPLGESHDVVALRARKAVDGLRRFARRFPLGGPYAHLWHGLLQWSVRRHTRAYQLWQRAIDLSERLRTPYERGRAHLEIGRHQRPEGYGRRHHLDQAVEIFERLGCVRDRDRALAELGGARAGSSVSESPL